jgi:hypothetical protein
MARYSKINISHLMRAFQQYQEQAPNFQKNYLKIFIESFWQIFSIFYNSCRVISLKVCQTSSVHLNSLRAFQQYQEHIVTGHLVGEEISKWQTKQNKLLSFLINGWLQSIQAIKLLAPLKQAIIYYIHPISLKPRPLYYYPESGPKKKQFPRGQASKKACYKCFFKFQLCVAESQNSSGDQFHNKMELHCTIAGTVTLAGCHSPVFCSRHIC